VDILVERNHACSAASRLKELGFRVEVVEPYCVTLTSRRVHLKKYRGRGVDHYAATRYRRAIVDLYVHPTLGGVAYLDGRSS